MGFIGARSRIVNVVWTSQGRDLFIRTYVLTCNGCVSGTTMAVPLLGFPFLLQNTGKEEGV